VNFWAAKFQSIIAKLQRD